MASLHWNSVCSPCWRYPCQSAGTSEVAVTTTPPSPDPTYFPCCSRPFSGCSLRTPCAPPPGLPLLVAKLTPLTLSLLQPALLLSPHYLSKPLRSDVQRRPVAHLQARPVKLLAKLHVAGSSAALGSMTLVFHRCPPLQLVVPTHPPANLVLHQADALSAHTEQRACLRSMLVADSKETFT